MQILIQALMTLKRPSTLLPRPPQRDGVDQAMSQSLEVQRGRSKTASWKVDEDEKLTALISAAGGVELVKWSEVPSMLLPYP